jgi:nitrite reductase/ring-hydroxylating ferredoxin subunit
MKEIDVSAEIKDLEEGQLKSVPINDKQKILLSKYNDKVYATSNECSHFGLPLHLGKLKKVIIGYLADNKVICPFHQAGFDVTNGKNQLAPGLDDI